MSVFLVEFTKTQYLSWTKEASIVHPYIFHLWNPKIRIMEIVTVALIKMQEGGGWRVERKREWCACFSHSGRKHWLIAGSQLSTRVHSLAFPGALFWAPSETQQFEKRLSFLDMQEKHPVSIEWSFLFFKKILAGLLLNWYTILLGHKHMLERKGRYKIKYFTCSMNLP